MSLFLRAIIDLEIQVLRVESHVLSFLLFNGHNFLSLIIKSVFIYFTTNLHGSFYSKLNHYLIAPESSPFFLTL